MSHTDRREPREPAERPFPYVPRAVPVAVQPADVAPAWQPVPPVRRRGGYAELARTPRRVPTRQHDAWQVMADRATAGWTTH